MFSAFVLLSSLHLMDLSCQPREGLVHNSGSCMIKYGDDISLVNQYIQPEHNAQNGYYLDTWSALGHDRKGFYVSTASPGEFDGGSATWRFAPTDTLPRGSGAVHYGDKVQLVNQYKPGNSGHYLNTWTALGHSRGGFNVSTATAVEVDGLSATWQVAHEVDGLTCLTGPVKYGDKIQLVNLYKSTTSGYLNTWSHLPQSTGRTGFNVSTASAEEVDGGSATWQIVPSNHVAFSQSACSVLPTIDGVNELLLQALATFSAKLTDNDKLAAKFEPESGQPDDKLDQSYKCSKTGGEYTDGAGHVVKGFSVFSADIARYGEVIDGFTDWHGKYEAAVPPFAALVVRPKDDGNAARPVLMLAWRGSTSMLDWINDAAFSPTLSTRWSGETKDVRAHGGYVNLVENTFSLHEDKLVDLIEKHKVERAFFTGHSLGGGMANVAHLIVRGQLKKAGSPWAKLDSKVTWLACTFAAPQTIVRLYAPKAAPPLIVDLDASSYNIVYGCDTVPRAPGMLKYLGDIVEIVVPKIVNEEVGKLVYSPIITFVEWFTNFKDLGTVALVKYLKNKGTAEVMGRFTHLGTVVYKKDETLDWMMEYGWYHLTGNASIQKQLDVGGDEFISLLGDSRKYEESLLAAHGHFRNFAFGAFAETGTPLYYGDKIKLVNQYDPTNGYLNTWGSISVHRAGFDVSTSPVGEFDGGSAYWQIARDDLNTNSGPVNNGDKIKLVNQYDPTNGYLNTWGSISGDPGHTGFDVSTSSVGEFDGKSSTWQIALDDGGHYGPVNYGDKIKLLNQYDPEFIRTGNTISRQTNGYLTIGASPRHTSYPVEPVYGYLAPTPIPRDRDGFDVWTSSASELSTNKASSTWQIVCGAPLWD